MAGEVDDPGMGSPGAAHALAQAQPLIPSPLGIVEAFHGGRRCAEHRWHAEPLGAQHGHIPGPVSEAVLLLVGAVVLLVDDDQTRSGERGKDG